MNTYSPNYTITKLTNSWVITDVNNVTVCGSPLNECTASYDTVNGTLIIFNAGRALFSCVFSQLNGLVGGTPSAKFQYLVDSILGL